MFQTMALASGSGVVDAKTVAVRPRPDVPHLPNEVVLDDRSAVRGAQDGVRVAMPTTGPLLTVTSVAMLVGLSC